MNIFDAIPHRPPFLLVDEIVGIDGNTIRTRKRVDPADPVFQGHFPGFPVMPGVLICEAIVQSGAILIAHLSAGAMHGSVPVLTRLNNVKFKQMVRPGDVLDMEASLKEKLAAVYFMEGSARVNGKLAVSLEFACTAAEQK
ncbi:MAG: 3-hydroxyacyl-ACP dehydratase FabZ [Planctomycetota bacterium]|nr:3-hydroxyacyl-ACP dehydratase FabZ [Planctomycetota bacterium]